MGVEIHICVGSRFILDKIDKNNFMVAVIFFLTNR